MSTDANDADPSTDTIKEKRKAVLDEVEELRQDVKKETGSELAYIKTNINLAKDELLNDGEYNYCVRLALIQLNRAVVREEGRVATLKRIEEFRDKLAEKAVLPPRDQVTR